MIEIIVAVIICIFVGVGCYEWGYNKAAEKTRRLKDDEIRELKREHQKFMNNILEDSNKNNKDI